MKFRYPYQKIVDLKENETQQAQWMLSTSLHQLQSEETSLEQLYIQKRQVQEQILSHSASGSSISELQRLQDYLAFLEVRIQAQSDSVQHATERVHQHQRELQSRKINEQTWNKAREKALYTHMKESIKKEQAILDDLVSVRNG
ncbi:flagellar export protein FliJ [Marinicrinis sediminis]|uniref:Flagellar FliJ protein n=1 Tax=Marinicrinis sediminis TaxID=1652465 RepID=A0ABW5R520_9BACL